MSRLGEKIAKRLKAEFGIEVKPEITRSYTRTFDAGEARFYMDYVHEQYPWYLRFEDRATDVANAKKLSLYYPDAYMPRGLDNRELTVLVEEYGKRV